MTRREEAAYDRGRRSAYAALALDVARELPRGKGRPMAVLAERVRAVQALRDLAEEIGLKVEIDEDLHLADTIEKRFGRALKAKLDGLW